MEKIGVLESAERWKIIREIHNAISHEYEEDSTRLNEVFGEMLKAAPELFGSRGVAKPRSRARPSVSRPPRQGPALQAPLRSHVQVSFEVPEYTADTDGFGTLRILEAIRILGMERQVRFYQASTSELYGKAQEIPQGW